MTAATDIPDTEQPADWHRHRWLTTHGQPTDGCEDTCCTDDEEETT